MVENNVKAVSYTHLTVSTFVRILLEVACAVWLSNLGRSWLRGVPFVDLLIHQIRFYLCQQLRRDTGSER